MKNFLFLLIFSTLFAVSGFSQAKDYITSGTEMIFSFASIKDSRSNTSPDLLMRWAPVLNLQSMYNHDMSSKVGLFTGLALRNVGYIYDNFKDETQGLESDVYVKKKFRSYNLGLPVGIKVGNLNRVFFYAGYEVEVPFLYKEKTFDDGDKIDKITGWFSPRQEMFQHGFLAGIQFPHGLNLKFKYYLSEFHNQSYTDSQGNKPYNGLESHVFYFSLSSYLFQNLSMIK
ncbi:MAG TPA: hypothetical protein VN249_07780 [Prolixibacteraceae bacterium]|nr:hypothetical protein [Prolixibacteraceae bacterium]